MSTKFTLAGVVLTKREGKFIHYSIDYPRVASVLKAVDAFLDAE
jgi:hypothetical protein